jgi:hypothetical protein
MLLSTRQEGQQTVSVEEEEEDMVEICKGEKRV